MKHGTNNVPNVVNQPTSKSLNQMRMEIRENPMAIAMNVTYGLDSSLTPSFMQHHWKQKGRREAVEGKALKEMTMDTVIEEDPGHHQEQGPHPDQGAQQGQEAGPHPNWNMPQQEAMKKENMSLIGSGKKENGEEIRKKEKEKRKKKKKEKEKKEKNTKNCVRKERNRKESVSKNTKRKEESLSSISSIKNAKESAKRNMKKSVKGNKKKKERENKKKKKKEKGNAIEKRKKKEKKREKGKEKKCEN